MVLEDLDFRRSQRHLAHRISIFLIEIFEALLIDVGIGQEFLELFVEPPSLVSFVALAKLISKENEKTGKNQ